MQNYYGMAIRQNPGQLHEMKKGIGAVLWHCSDIQDLEVRHQFCPKSIHSWCKYQSDKITGMSTYKPFNQFTSCDKMRNSGSIPGS